MYRPGSAGARADSLAGSAVGRMGLLLESSWLAYRFRRVARTLISGAATGTVGVPALSRQRGGRTAELSVALAAWQQAFVQMPEKETVVAAAAIVCGRIASVAAPEGGAATLLAAAAVSLAGEQVRIVVADIQAQSEIEPQLDRLWHHLQRAPRPAFLSLVDMGAVSQPVPSGERQPFVILHDAGDLLAITGERLVIQRGARDIGIAEFVRRALAFAEDAREKDYHLDREAGELTLEESYLNTVQQGAAFSFGVWRNCPLREEAARAGILVVHCLREEDVNVENDRVVPANPAAAKLIVGHGVRLEAVLAAHFGVDPQPLVDQTVRRMREALVAEEISGGIAFGDAALMPFFWRVAGLLTVSCVVKKERVIPQPALPVQPSASETVVDFRAVDPDSTNVQALYQPAGSFEALRVIGQPVNKRALAMLDRWGSLGVAVNWELSPQDIFGEGPIAGTLEFFPPRIRWPLMRFLCVWQLQARERVRCRRLEKRLVSQERMSSLLAITNSG